MSDEIDIFDDFPIEVAELKAIELQKEQINDVDTTPIRKYKERPVKYKLKVAEADKLHIVEEKIDIDRCVRGRKPGRPSKSNISSRGGISIEPDKLTNCIELVYDIPNNFKKIFTLIAAYGSTSVVFEFKQDIVFIKAFDRSNVTKILTSINVDEINHYYFDANMIQSIDLSSKNEFGEISYIDECVTTPNLNNVSISIELDSKDLFAVMDTIHKTYTSISIVVEKKKVATNFSMIFYDVETDSEIIHEFSSDIINLDKIPDSIDHLRLDLGGMQKHDIDNTNNIVTNDIVTNDYESDEMQFSIPKFKMEDFIYDDYPLDVEFSCQYFKKLISNLNKISDDFILQKKINGPLKIPVKKNNTETNYIFNNSDNKVNINYRGKDHLFTSACKLGYLKPLSVSIIGNTIKIYADSFRNMIFQINLDETFEILINTQIIA
jgi:hypothetical protein